MKKKLRTFLLINTGLMLIWFLALLAWAFITKAKHDAEMPDCLYFTLGCFLSLYLLWAITSIIYHRKMLIESIKDYINGN